MLQKIQNYSLIFGALSAKKQNGTFRVSDDREVSLFLIPMLMMHVFKYATPDNMH